MQIHKMVTQRGYQIDLVGDTYIYFDEVKDWGSNIMFMHKGQPSGGMWPPQSDEFLAQWEKIKNELPR